MLNYDIDDVSRCINVASKFVNIAQRKYLFVGISQHVAIVARASYESARWSRHAVIFAFFIAKNSLEFFREISFEKA